MKRFNSDVLILLNFIILGMLIGCTPEYTPKPKGFFRIEFPEKAYREFSPDGCPFTFKHPVYSKVIRDSSFFDAFTENNCWMDIIIPSFGGKIHLSYKEITQENNLSKLIEDAHKLTFKHTVKADFIDELYIKNQNGSGGVLYEVGGDAASAIQFFLTDSSSHYLRGALYFNGRPNVDSMAPIIGFVRQDLLYFLQSFKWESANE